MSTRNLGYVLIAVTVLFLLSDYLQQALAIAIGPGAN